MEREETEQIYRRLSEEERLSLLVNASQAFDAIQDEVNHFLANSDNVSENAREVLNRIEALARHRFDFRTEEEVESVKSPEFRKSV
jgi:dsDNA-specific endonuclease/ATPase MutS2